MTLKPTYVSLLVSDMAAALAFYRLLGLPIPADADPGAVHVEITVGGLRLAWETEALMRELNPAFTPPSPKGRVALAFEAASPAEVDAAAQRLAAAGYAVTALPFDAAWGQRYATVLDPDGTALDLFAWLPPGLTSG